jgi:DNA-binding transcriptional LysR family regulator
MKREEWSIQEFRALHACIMQGSITGAARQIGKSQPAISRAISNLEYKLGTKLFERSGKSIIATEEAHRIKAETSAFFLMLDNLREESVSRHSPMTLKIAAPPNFSSGFIQSVIASFLKVHENVRIELEVAISTIVIDKVAKNEVDIGISDMEIDTHDILREPFGYSFMACFLPSHFPLAQNLIIKVEDLKDMPLIGLTKRHSARSKLETVFKKMDIKPNIILETNNSLSALKLVENGVGIVLMNPFPLAEKLNDKVVILPFEKKIKYDPAFIFSPNRAVKKSTRWFISHFKDKLQDNIYLASKKAKLGKMGHE